MFFIPRPLSDNERLILYRCAWANQHGDYPSESSLASSLWWSSSQRYTGEVRELARRELIAHKNQKTGQFEPLGPNTRRQRIGPNQPGAKHFCSVTQAGREELRRLTPADRTRYHSYLTHRSYTDELNMDWVNRDVREPHRGLPADHYTEPVWDESRLRGATRPAPTPRREVPPIPDHIDRNDVIAVDEWLQSIGAYDPPNPEK